MDASKRLSMAAMFGSSRGMLCRRDVRALGLTDHEIDAALARHELVARRRGVLEPAGMPHDPERGQRAAHLAGGAHAVLSHFAAGGLLGFPGITPGALELSFRNGRRGRLDGARCHVAPDLDDADIALVRGMPCTSLARTTLDLGPLLAPAALRKIVAFVERRLRPNAFVALEGAASRISPMRRPLLAPTLGQIRRIADGDPCLDMTPRVRAALSRAGLPSPVAELPVTWQGHAYVCDDAYVEARIDLEYDDDHTHATKAGTHADKVRDRRGGRSGWEVVRAHQEDDPDEIAQHVAWLLATRSAA